jgi:hypothetical protein
MEQNKTLGGAIFVRNAIQYDYNIIESINCLLAMCDEVVVLDAGSTDGTLSLIMEHLKTVVGDCNLETLNNDFTWSVSSKAGNKVTLVVMRPEDWNNQHGKEKLALFQNVALERLRTDYVFLLQADEIVHEDSFPWIRQAMEDNLESYLCHRINLWGNPDHYLDVPQERKPCSDVVLRLAKKGALSYGDGESLEALPTYDKYVEKIKILHYGFVRNRKVMVDKIINMQANVFEITPDSKLDGMILFDPFVWFSKEDLKPLVITHPVFIQQWVEQRRKEYQELW